MKLINADLVVHWEAYDDEHESFTRHSDTIAEFLDQMTDEGCPETMDAVPVQRCKDRINQEIDELKENGKKHSDDVRQNGLLIAEGLRVALRIVEEVFLKDGDGNDRT